MKCIKAWCVVLHEQEVPKNFRSVFGYLHYNLQFAILDRSPREMSQTDCIHPRYFLSRVRVSIRPRIFLYAKKPQTTVARPAAVDRRSVADKQLNWNGRNPFSLRSSVPRAQRENVVAECSDHGSNPVQGTIFFSFLLFAINKAYF